MLLLTQNHGAIHDELRRRLEAVESRFGAELLSDLACVNTLAEHVERYRGKMLRPTLVLASSMAMYPRRADDEAFQQGVEIVATVVEMVHMATLVHDDILDEAEMRRRGATINHLRGNEAAVMLGDYLISHAYHLCSAIPLPAASRAIAAATNTVCEGELLQLHHREDWSLTQRTYFEIIRRKTASLCGACCRMPAVLASGEVDGGDEPAARVLYDFGQSLGLAFQIIDDVLDLSGEPAEVGKTLGRDLAKGKLTLPLIHLLDSSDEPERATLLETLRQPDGEAAAAALRDHPRLSESLDHARQWAGRLIAEAKTQLHREVEATPARAVLTDLADAVIDRRL